MDVWLHGSALVALWVIAAALVFLVLLVGIMLARVSEVARVVAPQQDRAPVQVTNATTPPPSG